MITFLARLLPVLPPEERDAVRSARERFFQNHTMQQGVVLPAAFWVVQARA